MVRTGEKSETAGQKKASIDQLYPTLTGLGGRVMQRREELKLSRPELAKLAGTDAARILRLEREQRVSKLSINVVAAVAHALKCRFGWLATGEPPVEPIPIDSDAVIVAVTPRVRAEQARQLREIAAALELLDAPLAKRKRAKGNKPNG